MGLQIRQVLLGEQAALRTLDLVLALEVGTDCPEVLQSLLNIFLIDRLLSIHRLSFGDSRLRFFLLLLPRRAVDSDGNVGCSRRSLHLVDGLPVRSQRRLQIDILVLGGRTWTGAAVDAATPELLQDLPLRIVTLLALR